MSLAPSTLQKRQIWLTVAIFIVALWIAGTFLSAIGWAAVLAIAEWPLFARLAARMPKRTGLLAMGFTFATGLFVILPFSLVATSLASESQGALAWFQHVQQTGLPAPTWLSGIPLAGDKLAAWWQSHLGTAAGAKQLLGSVNTQLILQWARVIAGEAAKESGLFLITLLALVSLLGRGHQIAFEAKSLAERLFGRFGEDFLAQLIEAVRHTVAGTLLVSVIEGSIIGVGYAVAGVPQPLLFTVITIVLAFIPFGAWAAFGLAALILIAQDHVIAGVILFVFGATIMTLGDNVVQPAVIGGAMKLPFLLALVGTFGGLATMGLIGLFLGPVIMVAVVLIWREWSSTRQLEAA